MGGGTSLEEWENNKVTNDNDNGYDDHYICIGIPILKIVLPHAHMWVTSDVIL